MVRKTATYLTTLWFDEGVPPDAGEEHRHLLGLARAAVAASWGRWQVEVVGYGPCSRRESLGDGVTLRCMRAAAVTADPGWRLSWELPQAIAGTDLVHVHHPYTRTADLGLMLARQAGQPACVTAHGGTVNALGVPMGSLALAQHLVCPSDLALAFLRTQVPPDRLPPVEILKGGVDTDFFTPPVALGPRNRLLFVGRLVPPQGIERLIAALPSGVALTICGQVCPYHLHYHQYLQERARNRPVEIVAPASAGAVRALYREAWACVLPQVCEDYGGTARLGTEVAPWAALEAMACGTPVVAARAGCLPEFVTHGETGFLFDHDDDLTRYLAHLAHDPRLVEELGGRACRTVAEQFGFKALAPQLVAHYDSLTAEERHRPAGASWTAMPPPALRAEVAA